MKTSSKLGFVSTITNRRSHLLGLTAIALLMQLSGNLQAAVESRSVLKSYFQTGDKPTAPQFATLIDSVINFSEDRYLLGLRNYDPAFSIPGAPLSDPGTIIDGSLLFGAPAGLADEWAGRTGYLPLTFRQGSSPEPHYGYLTITAGGSGDVYPMFISSFTFEDQANTPLLITQVPEPSSIALATIAGLAGLGFWRRNAGSKRTLQRRD